MKNRITILCFLFLPIIFFSQSHEWVRTNPGGGGAFSTIGASANGIIIAGSDLSGAYRSLDQGQTWDVIGVNKNLTETHVSGLGFHRINGNLIYIGTENGIFRSIDGGENVSQVLVGGYITDIEFGTNSSDIGYASFHPTFNSNNGVIYKSTNNGLTWFQISTNLPNGIRILKITVDPNNSDIVYCLSGDGRFACGPADVFKSIDGGVTWINTTSALSEILDFAIDPSNPETVYLTTMNADCNTQFYWTDVFGDLYKSTNGGDTWGSPLSDYTGVIWLDPNNSNIIKLIDPREPYPWNSRSGTFTSTNEGVNFSKTGYVEDWDTFFQGDVFYAYGTSFNGICKTLGEDLSNPQNYFWVNPQWAFKTEDNGIVFQNIFTDEISSNFWKSRGFDNVNMMDISISKANPNIIYTAFFDIGIWRSLDHGESWQSCNDDTYSGNWNGFGGNCATIIADPDRENIVWASLSENQNGQAPTYFLKNENTGQKNSWTLSNSGLPEVEVMGLSLDVNSPTNNRTLYITANKDVYKSTNDGNTWTQIFNCNGCRFTAVDQFNSSIVYAGGENGLWRSLNDGIDWEDVSHVQMPTNNGAEFWDWNYYGIFDLKTDPNNENWLYVTALGNDKGLYKSTDKGNNWTKILTDDFMRKVAIVPQHSNVIYATSSSAFEAGGYDNNSKGVWYSEDEGQTWVQQNQEMAYPFAVAVAVDTYEDATVFIGSPGTGFQKSLVSYTQLNVSNFENENIQVFPNPFKNEITVSNQDKIFSITVYDIFGKLIVKYKNIYSSKIIVTKKLLSQKN